VRTDREEHPVRADGDEHPVMTAREEHWVRTGGDERCLRTSREGHCVRTTREGHAARTHAEEHAVGCVRPRGAAVFQGGSPLGNFALRFVTQVTTSRPQFVAWSCPFRAESATSVS